MKRRSLLFLLGLVILLAAVWIYLPPISRYRELKLEEERMDRELADLTAKINGLEEERELLKNDVTYLEKVIRDELGLVKPDEIVYKFVPKKKEEEIVMAPFEVKEEQTVVKAPTKKTIPKSASKTTS